MFLTPLISAPVDIAIMLVGAFLIGFLTAWLWRKIKIDEQSDQQLKLQKDIRELHLINENLDLAKDKLQHRLNEYEENMEHLVSAEKVQKVSMELRQERERSETARRSLTEIESAHEALKQELQLKIDQMLSPEEANKLRAEVNRLRVFNASLEDDLKELKEKEMVVTSEAPGLNGPANQQSTEFVKSIGVKEATSEEKDDLKQISGVGPFIEEKLNRLGIYTFEQIASLTGEQAEQINHAIEFFPGRIQRDDWVTQARELINR